MSEPSRLRVGLAYAAICVIWGSTYLAIKVGLESFTPLFYAGVRYALAAALAFVVARATGVVIPGPASRWWPVAGIGVLLIAVSNGLVFWSETRLDSGFTALLLTTSPVWAALLSPLFPGEPAPHAAGWAGIGLGFAGTVVMLEPWRAGAVPLLAAAAAELSVVAWTAGSLWARRIRGTFHPMAISVVQMTAGAVVLLAATLPAGQALAGPVTPRAAASLAYLVVVGSVVAFAAYFYLLQHWGATRVATSTYVNPVVAVLLGALLLHEAVTWSMVVGALIVFAGVTLVLRDERGAARG